MFNDDQTQTCRVEANRVISCLATDQLACQPTSQPANWPTGQERASQQSSLSAAFAYGLHSVGPGMQNCFMNYKQCPGRGLLVACLLHCPSTQCIFVLSDNPLSMPHTNPLFLSLSISLSLSPFLAVCLSFGGGLIALTVIMSPSDIHQQMCNLLPLPIARLRLHPVCVRGKHVRLCVRPNRTGCGELQVP